MSAQSRVRLPAWGSAMGAGYLAKTITRRRPGSGSESFSGDRPRVSFQGKPFFSPAAAFAFGFFAASAFLFPVPGAERDPPGKGSPGSPASLLSPEPRPSGEPYELATKRLAFTSWRYVRPGTFVWLDAGGRNVTVSGSEGPREARLRLSDAPRGVRLASERAKREGPIFPPGNASGEKGTAITTILKDGSTYKAWGIFVDERGSRPVYYESPDGRSWSKLDAPITVDGVPGELNLGEGTVFVDPQAPPEERFKLVTLGRFGYEEFEAYRKRHPDRWEPRAIREDAGCVFFIEGFVSPDGLAWKRLPEPLCVEHSDTQIVAYYDSDLRKYVIYTRNWMVDPISSGAPARVPWYVAGRRSIGRTESEDFRRFPPSVIILVPSLDWPPSDVLYTNGRTCLPGAPREHLLFPTVWHMIDDSTSVLLASSHDGRAWNYVPGGAVLETAEFGAWDGGCVFARPNLIELPDGSFVLPYTGYDVPHKYPRGRYRFGTGYMVWPKGRLVGIEAEDRGEFSTVGFVYPGGRLLSNARTTRGGRLLVEVARLGGEAVEGRSFAECDPIFGDVYREAVRWRGKEDLGVDRGAPVILRFRLERAKLFWVEFD